VVPKALLFPPFRLDLLNEELWRGSDRIPLRPKEFAVLSYLANNPRRLVTKQELLDQVWPQVSVADELLRGYIRELRQALGDAASAPQIIETVSRRGYRFLPSVKVETEPAVGQPSPTHGRDRIVGRDSELQALEDALTRASKGERRTILIAGEPGTGKTTLLKAFLERARTEPAVAIGEAACAQGYDAGERFVPWIHALGSLCRGVGRGRFIQQLERHAPAWLMQLPDLVPDIEYEHLQEKGRGATAPRLRREYAAALELIAGEVTVVLAIEDLQWCDPEAADLFAALAREGPAGVLLLATYRRVDAITTAHPIRALALELVAEGRVQELSMTDLGRQHVAEYLQARFPNHAFPPSFSRALYECTSGSPAVMVKLTDRLVDGGELEEVEGRWRLHAAGVSSADVDADVPAPLQAFLQARVRELSPVLRARAALKVAVLHSLTGTMAWTEMPVVDATLLAIEEINQRGGIRGHRIDPVVVDGQSDEATFAHCAQQLIEQEQVCTIFGCWTSASRKTVRPIVEARDHLLVYPVQYEGMERSPNILYTGAAPNQQITPAIRWAFGFLAKRRFFLVGWDSIYSHAVNEIIGDEVRSLGGAVVGEAYLLPHTTNIDLIVRQIADTQPDVIVNSLVGDTNVLYSRALHASGHRSDRIPTIYFSVSEIELVSLSASESVGDFAAWNYFQSLDRPQNQAFVSRFRARYGRRRVTADPMEAAYVGVHLWGQAVEAADSDDPRAIRMALATQTFDAPEGLVTIDSDSLHLWKTFRLGQIVKGGQLEVVWSSGAPIRPEPFPSSRSAEAWQAFLAECFAQWGGHWTNPAVSAV
jgi:urea transport system substrate-binding protein